MDAMTTNPPRIGDRARYSGETISVIGRIVGITANAISVQWVDKSVTQIRPKGFIAASDVAAEWNIVRFNTEHIFSVENA